jgi:membrane protein implicated in regulation of membrane protease activity
MNSAFLIILVPALLVAAGYIFVLRFLGFAPGYPQLIVLLAVLLAATYWLWRRGSRNSKTDQH